jgi:hypothetical protein
VTKFIIIRQVFKNTFFYNTKLTIYVFTEGFLSFFVIILQKTLSSIGSVKIPKVLRAPLVPPNLNGIHTAKKHPSSSTSSYYSSNNKKKNEDSSSSSSSRKNNNKKSSSAPGETRTSMKWDFSTVGAPPLQPRALDYGEELYERALKKIQLEEEEALLLSSTGESAGVAGDRKSYSSSCNDYSTPAYNSSKSKESELEKALEELKHLPIEIERLFRTDKRFELIIMSQVNKNLSFFKIPN